MPKSRRWKMALALARHLNDSGADRFMKLNAIDAACLWAYEQGHEVPNNDLGRDAVCAVASANLKEPRGPVAFTMKMTTTVDVTVDKWTLVDSQIEPYLPVNEGDGHDKLAAAWHAVRRVAYRRLKMATTYRWTSTVSK